MENNFLQFEKMLKNALKTKQKSPKSATNYFLLI